MASVMPRIPQWRIDPDRVWLKCEDMRDLNKDEAMVQFVANGERYLSFVPQWFLDKPRLMLQALVIADVEGGLLVDIPVETLTSGPRIFVPTGEKEAVLDFAGWGSRNGS